jgi:hypothetical protein
MNRSDFIYAIGFHAVADSHFHAPRVAAEIGALDNAAISQCQCVSEAQNSGHQNRCKYTHTHKILRGGKSPRHCPEFTTRAAKEAFRRASLTTPGLNSEAQRHNQVLRR